MENTQANPTENTTETTKLIQTPHELYNHHLLHPDEPITDEAISNLKIDTGAVARDHQLTNEESIASSVTNEESKERAHIEENATDSEKRKASPYDILGG